MAETENTQVLRLARDLPAATESLRDRSDRVSRIERCVEEMKETLGLWASAVVHAWIAVERYGERPDDIRDWTGSFVSGKTEKIRGIFDAVVWLKPRGAGLGTKSAFCAVWD